MQDREHNWIIYFELLPNIGYRTYLNPLWRNISLHSTMSLSYAEQLLQKGDKSQDRLTVSTLIEIEHTSVSLHSLRTLFQTRTIALMPSLLIFFYLSWKEDGSKGWYLVLEHLLCFVVPLKLCHNPAMCHIYIPQHGWTCSSPLTSCCVPCPSQNVWFCSLYPLT